MSNDNANIGTIKVTRGDKLVKLVTNISYPTNISLPPFSKLTLFNDINFKGKNISITNSNDITINIDEKNVQNSDFSVIKSVQLESISSEGFSENTVRDICLYTCSNFNYMNLILCVVLIIIVYYLFNNINK